MALKANTIGVRNTASGAYSLQANQDGHYNTALGNGAGYSNISGSRNVFLGYDAGSNETGSDKLFIESSNANSDNALIYSEFDNNILRTNGTSQIGNPTGTGYSFPTTDGTTNQVLRTDGSETMTWSDVSYVQKIDNLSDGKSDAIGSPVFLGKDAGAVDDGSDNENVGVGFESLKANNLLCCY